MVVKLERKAELSLLPEILRHRINLLKMDAGFIYDEGREVRICLLGYYIFKERQKSEKDFLKAAQRVIEKGDFPERATFSSDELERAIAVADALCVDKKSGIELDNPTSDDLRKSICMILGSPSSIFACKSYANPRSKYIEKYATRIESSQQVAV